MSRLIIDVVITVCLDNAHNQMMCLRDKKCNVGDVIQVRYLNNPAWITARIEYIDKEDIFHLNTKWEQK